MYLKWNGHIPITEEEEMSNQSWLFIKASWKGGGAFTIENRYGSQISLEIRGKDKNNRDSIAPVEAFIASLGGCAGVNVIMMLQEEGISPDACTVKVECLLNNEIPRTIEKIHLNFLLTGMIEDKIVESVITRAMTLMCPIAVTVGKATEITWEHGISRHVS